MLQHPGLSEFLFQNNPRENREKKASTPVSRMPHVEVPQAEFKVVMLGDTFTGKTSLVQRFVEGNYRESVKSPTVGASFTTKLLTIHGMTCKVQIWDTAGQEQFKRLAPMYYKNAAAAIVCYDMQSPKSFKALRYWVDELRESRKPENFVMALCATKLDLSAVPVDTSEAEELAQEIGAIFMTTSAKDDTNVTEIFQAVAEKVLATQLDGDGSTVSVTMGTALVETGESRVLGKNTKAQSQARSASSPKSGPAYQDEKKQELDDDDDVIHPSESRQSTVDSNAGTRCDSMLMCGDSDLMGGDTGQCCMQ